MNIKLKLMELILLSIRTLDDCVIAINSKPYIDFVNSIEKLLPEEKHKINGNNEQLQNTIHKINNYTRCTKSKNSTDKITKDKIIKLFQHNVKGKSYVKSEKENDGSEGHWLEKLMGLIPNSKNLPDIGGYEMKKNSPIISFGDWSASEYLFSQKHPTLNTLNNENITMTKEEYIKYFGNKNNKKDNRYSWSGSCVPKYDKWNNCGQILEIHDGNIFAVYSYDHDERINKIADKFKNKKIYMAVWTAQKMKKCVNDKFNQKGFFICKKNKDNIYDKICFGQPISFELFIEQIKNQNIYFDSGMYFDGNKSNNRLYSHWRAGNKFWKDLIIEEH